MLFYFYCMKRRRFNERRLIKDNVSMGILVFKVLKVIFNFSEVFIFRRFREGV